MFLRSLQRTLLSRPCCLPHIPSFPISLVQSLRNTRYCEEFQKMARLSTLAAPIPSLRLRARSPARGGYMCWVSSRKAVLPRRRGRQKILNRQRNFIGVYLATMRMLDGSEWDGRGMELAGLSSTKNQWLQFSWNHCRDSLPPPANSLRANLAVPRLRNVPCIHIRRKLFASQCRLQFCQLRCNRPGMVLVMVSSDE